MAAPPVTSEIIPHNGAVIAYDALLRKYGCWSPGGEFCGYRYTVERARELASRLPGLAAKEPEPAPVSRSPHALPAVETQYLPHGVPRDERVDLFEVRAPTVLRHGGAYLDEVVARQRRAFSAVYGRRLRRR